MKKILIVSLLCIGFITSVGSLTSIESNYVVQENDISIQGLPYVH